MCAVRNLASTSADFLFPLPLALLSVYSFGLRCEEGEVEWKGVGKEEGGRGRECRRGLPSPCSFALLLSAPPPSFLSYLPAHFPLPRGVPLYFTNLFNLSFPSISLSLISSLPLFWWCPLRKNACQEGAKGGRATLDAIGGLIMAGRISNRSVGWEPNEKLVKQARHYHNRRMQVLRCHCCRPGSRMRGTAQSQTQDTVRRQGGCAYQAWETDGSSRAPGEGVHQPNQINAGYML